MGCSPYGGRRELSQDLNLGLCSYPDTSNFPVTMESSGF